MGEIAPYGSLDTWVEGTIHRLLRDGVEYGDFKKHILDNADHMKTMDDWCHHFMEAALEHQKIAEEALANGDTVTAGRSFARASLYYHFGQYNLWLNPSLRDEVVKRKVETYKRGAPYFQPPAQRVEVPFEGIMLPAYFRLPLGRSKPPCVILIGGLDSTKEEYYRFENILLARGLATFAVDGPGQGEVWYKMKVRHDFEKPVTAVVDYLVKRKDVDGERLGIFGRSTGGYYVSRAVAFEKRIKACCCLGCVDFSIFDSHARRLKDGWTYVSGKRNWDEAKEYFQSFTLKGVADKITCPLYILHGSKDPIMPNETAIWLSKQAKGPTTLDLCEGGHHGCFNTPGAHITQPRMADWLARTLTGAS